MGWTCFYDFDDIEKYIISNITLLIFNSAFYLLYIDHDLLYIEDGKCYYYRIWKFLFFSFLAKRRHNYKILVAIICKIKGNNVRRWNKLLNNDLKRIKCEFIWYHIVNVSNDGGKCAIFGMSQYLAQI